MILVAGAAATADLIINVADMPDSHDVGSITGFSEGPGGWMAGGSAAAVAIAAAAHTEVRLWHPLPPAETEETASRELLDALCASGVDTSECPTLEHYPVRCVTVVSASGTRLCWSEKLSPTIGSFDTLLEGVDHVVLTPAWGDWAVDLLAACRDRGIPASFVGEIPPITDDLRYEWAIADSRQIADATARHGAAPMAGVLVATQGSQGCRVYDQGSHYTVPAVPTRVVDTTGAGDVFSGTLIGLLAEGVATESAARTASETAARHCTTWGVLPAFQQTPGEPRDSTVH